MKDKKNKNAQQGKQNKQKTKETPGCLSFGKMDLIYKIEFCEKDLENPNGEGNEKYYNIENFNSIQDLKFIHEKKNIWDKITLKPNNGTLEQLLFANKMSKKKMNLYDRPKIEGDEEFFQEIFMLMKKIILY